MKVKQVPQDFVVEERARVRPTDRGPFALYLLRKEGIGTLEALRAVRRAWQVPGRAVGFGGLKDRHAVTTQWVTIPRGPRRNLDQPTFRLTYEGQFTQPMSRMLLEGNTFGIRIRDLSDREARTLSTRLADLATHGLPAYFDDQRFGSIRGDVPFAALLLLRGDAEGAFRAAVASPSREDRGPVKKRKLALARAWGHWEDALPHLHGTPTRAAVLHLVAHPDDFVGAFAALDREEKALFTSAWASSVWNRALAARVEALVAPDDRLVLPGASEPLVFAKDPAATASFGTAVLPLPAPNARATDPAWQAALEAALAADGLRADQLSFDPRLGLALRATQRPVLFRPDDLDVKPPEPDDLNAGRMRLDVRFALRPGTYATLLLKRATYDMGGAKALS